MHETENSRGAGGCAPELTNYRTPADKDSSESGPAIKVCPYCDRVKDASGRWISKNFIGAQSASAKIMHHICPECFNRMRQQWGSSQGSGA